MTLDGILEYAWPVGMFVGLVGAVIGWQLLRDWYRQRSTVKQNDKNEALYQSMFPDVAPLYHPKGLHEFATAWRARKAATEPYTWADPPGFPAAKSAKVLVGTKGEFVRLLGAGGALLTEFALARHNEGAAIRVGDGKFTVNTQTPSDKNVRYWHPNREFKWSERKGWRFTTPVADRSFDSDDSGTSYSSGSTSGSAASAAGVTGGGGTFDGGGASASWDGGGKATSY